MMSALGGDTIARYLNSGTYMGDRDALLHLLNFYADQWDFKCYNAVVRHPLSLWKCSNGRLHLHGRIVVHACNLLGSGLFSNKGSTVLDLILPALPRARRYHFGSPTTDCLDHGGGSPQLL